MGAFGRKALSLLGFAGMALLAAQPARAEICDLTAGTTSCTINDGMFSIDYQHPTGTGVIDPFLRLQAKGAEQGYNTSARSYPLPAPGPKTQFDEKSDPNYTRNLPTSELGTQTIDGKTYVEFFLDINEPGSNVGEKFKITLDQLEIYVSNTPNLDAYSSNGSNNASGSLGSTGGGGTATKIYDLDNNGNGDNWVNLSYLISGQGSGSSDMSFLLDASLFEGYEYVYLYSQFGDDTPMDKQGSKKKEDYKYESQAGFEEWFSNGNGPTTTSGETSGETTGDVPEPASLLLLGVGALSICISRRWKN